MTKTLSFYKYSGNGNDFAIFDEATFKPSSEMVQKLCHRQFGIGADGIVVLDAEAGFDARMRIYNADGSEAEMCGNALRCLVTFLDERLGKKQNQYKIKTMNAIYPVERRGESFALQMTEMKDKNIHDLSKFKDYLDSFFIDTGVPHLVFLVKELQSIDVKKVGAFYRYHPTFPRGANVNFVEITNKVTQEVKVRTYERGVEEETFSCGTGLTATSLALQNWFGWKGDIRLETKGGQHLVSLTDKVMYSGEVKFCFKGEISL